LHAEPHHELCRLIVPGVAEPLRAYLLDEPDMASGAVERDAPEEDKKPSERARELEGMLVPRVDGPWGSAAGGLSIVGRF
jgi:hypothetical protein